MVFLLQADTPESSVVATLCHGGVMLEDLSVIRGEQHGDLLPHKVAHLLHAHAATASL